MTALLTARSDRGPIPRLGLLLLALLLLGVNLPLCTGGSTEALAFEPARVWQGEWWRLLTWPLAHISLYHLALDGAAFLSLYEALPPLRGYERWLLISLCSAASLAAALAASPLLPSLGLRGLSGVAHGLMAAGATFQLRSRETRRLGAITLLGVVAKCVWECLTGVPLFGALHFGNVGVPIVECHAGGVLGGCLGAGLLSRASPLESLRGAIAPA